MKNKISLFFTLCLCFSIFASAQSEWIVAEEDGGLLSILPFDEDMAMEGRQIYQTSCKSCHGNPGQGDFTMMSPSPGDVADDRFVIQKDGELLYKIQKGRATMPSFENSYSESEIWTLVAYIRSFHPAYVQVFPDLEGIEIPQLALELGYDENVDQLVIKVSDDKTDQSEGVSVKAYVRGMFGNHYLGNATSNEYGLAYIAIDSKLPGDEEGYVNVLLKASKGYGNARLEERLQAAAPSVRTSIIEGRHLWSRARQAPIWMIVAFNLIGVGIWATIIALLIGLRKIKKLQ